MLFLPSWKIGYVRCRRSLSILLPISKFLHWTWCSLFRTCTSGHFRFSLSQLQSRPFLIFFLYNFNGLLEFKLKLFFLYFINFRFYSSVHFHYFVISIIDIINFILYLLHISNSLIRWRGFMLSVELFCENIVVRYMDFC